MIHSLSAPQYQINVCENLTFSQALLHSFAKSQACPSLHDLCLSARQKIQNCAAVHPGMAAKKSRHCSSLQ